MNKTREPDPPSPHVVDAGMVLQRLQILSTSIDACLKPLRSLLAELETSTCSDKSALVARLLKQCQADRDSLVKIGAGCQSTISTVEKSKVPRDAQPKPDGHEGAAIESDKPPPADKVAFDAKEAASMHARLADRVARMEERLKALRILKADGAETVSTAMVINVFDSIQGDDCADMVALDTALTAAGR